MIERPHGLKKIIGIFGDPDFYTREAYWQEAILADVCVPFALPTERGPVTRFRAHRIVAPILVEIFEEIARNGLARVVVSFDGCYAYRRKRGRRTDGSPMPWSTHAWGISVDLNADKNALGTAGNQPPRLVEIFEAAGFFWGARFRGRPDPMHFQYATGY